MSIPLDPDTVHDHESFSRFVEALIADRQVAEGLERDDPEGNKYGGANGWQNSTISDFLEAGLVGSNAWKSANEPSWRDLALFLYLGKIYE